MKKQGWSEAHSSQYLSYRWTKFTSYILDPALPYHCSVACSRLANIPSFSLSASTFMSLKFTGEDHPRQTSPKVAMSIGEPWEPSSYIAAPANPSTIKTSRTVVVFATFALNGGKYLPEGDVSSLTTALSFRRTAYSLKNPND
jgi:hypothetical protein